MVFGFFKKKPRDPEVEAAYQQSYREGRLERAKKEGYNAGLNLQTTSRNKIVKSGRSILSAMPTLANPNDPFHLSDTPHHKKTKHKRKKR